MRELPAWSSSGDTPLWLRICADLPISPVHLWNNVPSLVEYAGRSEAYDVPIYLIPGAEYGRVLDNVVHQLKGIWGMMNSR